MPMQHSITDITFHIYILSKYHKDFVHKRQTSIAVIPKLFDPVKQINKIITNIFVVWEEGMGTEGEL